MSYSLLAKKLLMEKERFIDAAKIKSYCKTLGLKYYSAIGYLLSEKYLIRILRGIFYITSIESKKSGTIPIGYYEAIKTALKMKGIKNWYFALESAIKLNNLTHETFIIEHIISDSFRNHRPITIFGRSTSFTKINISFDFGIVKGEIPHSDAERTILDMIYLLKQKGMPDERIHDNVAEYLDKCDKKKIQRYLKYYPKTIARLV